MRLVITVPALLLAGFALGGCVVATGPVGVLPRDPVSPPPSVSGQAPGGRTTSPRADATAQRRALSVPNRAASPRS